MKYIYNILLLRLHIYRAGKPTPPPQKKSSKLNVILRHLTFVIDRVARKPNRS